MMPLQIIKPPLAPTSRNLVFTSAGDLSNVRHWLQGRRDFDLWMVHYGEQTAANLEQANFCALGRGTKFQNLHKVYAQYAATIAQYEAVMVMDDDILIDATSLTRLFAIRQQHDLWVVQPAFRLAGKISWDITRASPSAQLRYTNFIEMTCPLFRRDKLDLFMAHFDPRLLGYGEDWWFLNLLGPQLGPRLAIADEVCCVNPYDSSKGYRREIDRVSTHEQRKAAWEMIKAAHGLHEQDRRHIEYGRIRNSWWGTARALAQYIPDWVCFKARRTVSSLRRLVA